MKLFDEMISSMDGTTMKNRWLSVKERYPPLYPATKTAVSLLVLFLAVQSYFYGSVYRSAVRVHGMRILAADYDQAEIGRAVLAAYERLRGPGFLTLEITDPAEVGSTAEAEESICGDRYWGVLYTRPGASARLISAVAGNDSDYSPEDAMTFVYSGIRYPVIGEAYLLADMARLTALATQELYAMDGERLLASMASDNVKATKALFRPLGMQAVAKTPAPQGAVILLNSFTMVVSR